MKLFKGLSKHDALYGGLILTFVVLYGATAFVSWYHAITFFNIANAMWLSVILSFVAEIGQASVLFSILLTELKKFSHVLLSWTIMILLTTLQVIGNVVSSYEWITTHGGAGVEAFQKSILFWMAAADPEIFKVVIAWITGALLPIIALSMTALVAQYMELKAENVKTHLDVDKPIPEPMPSPTIEPIPADIVMSEVSKIRLTDEEMNRLAELLKNKQPIEKVPSEEHETPIEEKKTSDPITSDEIHEEWTKMYGDIHKELDEEEVPPPDQLTDQEVIPHYSEEEVREIFMLDEDAKALTPLQSEEEIKKVVSEVGDPPIIVTHQYGLVDGILGSQPIEISNSEIYDETGESIGIKGESEPLPQTTPEDEEKKKQEEARVEKLRQIARDNLKKK